MDLDGVVFCPQLVQTTDPVGTGGFLLFGRPLLVFAFPCMVGQVIVPPTLISPERSARIIPDVC